MKKRKQQKARTAGSSALAKVQKYFPQVTAVRDADQPLAIEVTSHDATTSKRKKHTECALAVACKRSEKAQGVIISVRTAYLIKNNQATRYNLPERATREVVSFDRGGGFSTGEYKLNAPAKGHRLGTKGGNTSHTGKGKKITHVLTSGIRSVLGSKEV